MEAEAGTEKEERLDGCSINAPISRAIANRYYSHYEEEESFFEDLFHAVLAYSVSCPDGSMCAVHEGLLYIRLVGTPGGLFIGLWLLEARIMILGISMFRLLLTFGGRGVCWADVTEKFV